MMRAVFQSLIIVPLVALTFMPQMTLANDAETIREALAKEPFRDLPGVKLPQKLDDEPQTACTSSIRRLYWDWPRARLSRRVYRCEVDNVTVESTKQPDEVDWKKQKRYYKPWIGDGFDR